MPRTIFNSSEKSNFILNMTEKQYSKFASIGLILSCFLISLFTFIPEIFKTTTYSIVSAGLAICGVYCMIMTIISISKRYINGSSVFPVCAFAFMFLWGIVSLLCSFDVYTSLYGFPQRGEGMLAIMFYLCIFITGATVKRKKAADALMNALIGAGLLNSAVSLIQIFTGKLSHYVNITLETDTFSASGLAQSPLFLAMLLSLSLTAALITAVTTKSSKFRILCIVSSLFFGFVMMMTYSFIGICGIAFAVIAAVISLFMTKSPKKMLAALLPTVAGAAAAVIIVNAGLIGNISSYKLYDGRELWWADSYMRIGASGDFNYQISDIDDTLDLYLTMNSKTLDIIAKDPLSGTGPDQLAFPQIYTTGDYTDDVSLIDLIPINKGIFDRVYNEYLYTAATRGIPSAIALVIVLLSALIKGFKSMKKNKEPLNITIFFLVLCGSLLFLIGCSNITFSPIFWAIAGIAFAALDSDEKPEKANNKK